MSTMSTTGELSTAPSLLALPPEIRDEVYRHLFSTATCVEYSETDEPYYNFDLRIFRTCKAIYHEARRVFYAENSFACIETPWPQTATYIKSEGIGVVASGEVCADFQQAQLLIQISSPGVEQNNMNNFIIHIEELAKFCNLWFYSNLTYEMNSHLCLELVVHNRTSAGTPLPRETQKRLIEPFGLIRDLGKFDISGDVHPDILDRVKHDMAQPLDTPTTCVEKSVALLEAGNAKLDANKPREALDCYRESFLAIHIVVDGKFDRRIYAERFFEALLDRPFFGNQSAGFARVVLRIKLVAAVMLAYVKLEDYPMVYHWGLRSIKLYRRTLGEGADDPGHESFPAPQEWGKIYYRTALAAEELERDEEALEFYRIAKAWLPDDESVIKSWERFLSRTD